jgi:hypothetical protein
VAVVDDCWRRGLWFDSAHRARRFGEARSALWLPAILICCIHLLGVSHNVTLSHRSMLSSTHTSRYPICIPIATYPSLSNRKSPSIHARIQTFRQYVSLQFRNPPQTPYPTIRGIIECNKIRLAFPGQGAAQGYVQCCPIAHTVYKKRKKSFTNKVRRGIEQKHRSIQGNVVCW